MESIAMWVSHQDIPRTGDINTIREVGDVFESNATKEVTGLIKHYYTVTLEITHEVFFTWGKIIEKEILIVLSINAGHKCCPPLNILH